MLVLSRKVGERIHIGNDIMVEVRRISGNRVTLALRAPRDVRILRGELEKIAREFEDIEVEEEAEPAERFEANHEDEMTPSNQAYVPLRYYSEAEPRAEVNA